MSNILIIGDIHNRISWIEECLSKEKYDKIIFMGDYFDDFGDSALSAKKTAEWLKKSLTHKNRIHLLGNHDLAYFYSDVMELGCSGYTNAKRDMIESILTQKDFDKMKLFHYEDNFYFSHAGMTPWLFEHPHNGFSLEYLTELCEKAMIDLKHVIAHPILRAGRGRGGNQTVGGLTWCDWNQEFEAIHDVNQIVGHTIVKMPVHDDYDEQNNVSNWNVDTNNQYLCWLKDGYFSYEKNKYL